MRALSALLSIVAASGTEPPVPDMRATNDASSRYIGDPTGIKGGKVSNQLVCSACHGITGNGGRGPNLVTVARVRQASDQGFSA